MRGFTKYSLSVLISLFIFGCNKSKDSDQIVLKIDRLKGSPLITVGNVTLSLEEVKEEFLSRQGNFRGADLLNTPEKTTEYAEQAAVKEAIFQEALSEGYIGNNPEIKRDIKELIVQKFVREKLQDEQNKYEATPEEIKKYYDDNKDLFSKKEAVKVTYIKVPYAHEKPKAKKIAEELRAEAVKTVTNSNASAFIKVAMKYMNPALSAQSIKVESSHTGFEEKQMFDEKFGPGLYDSVVALGEIGTIGKVIEGKDSYLVIMKTGFRKAIDETLEEAQEKIKKKLAFDNRGNLYKNFTEELKKKYSVKIHEENIAKLSSAAQQEAKLAIPAAPAGALGTPQVPGAIAAGNPPVGVPTQGAPAQAGAQGVVGAQPVPATPSAGAQAPAAH